VPHTKLTSAQITGFWGAWSGWTLDGMDSFIYALVLSPALSELLPKSGYAKAPANVGLAGSILFALFLVGWGLSFMWGPIADRFGRTRVLAATILAYAVFTGAAALAQSVWQLGLFRLLAGIGIGGEWALGGTHVAGASVEDGFYWDSHSFHRNDIGMFDGSDPGGTAGKEEYSGYLFPRHERVHLVEFWLGVLSAEWPDNVYRLSIFSGIFWREFYFVQLVAPRAVRDIRSSHGLCICHFFWKVHRSRRQFHDWRNGSQRRNNWQAGCLYGDCVWTGALDHSVCARNSR